MVYAHPKEIPPGSGRFYLYLTESVRHAPTKRQKKIRGASDIVTGEYRGYLGPMKALAKPGGVATAMKARGIPAEHAGIVRDAVAAHLEKLTPAERRALLNEPPPGPSPEVAPATEGPQAQRVAPKPPATPAQDVAPNPSIVAASDGPAPGEKWTSPRGRQLEVLEVAPTYVRLRDGTSTTRLPRAAFTSTYTRATASAAGTASPVAPAPAPAPRLPATVDAARDAYHRAHKEHGEDAPQTQAAWKHFEKLRDAEREASAKAIKEAEKAERAEKRRRPKAPSPPKPADYPLQGGPTDEASVRREIEALAATRTRSKRVNYLQNLALYELAPYKLKRKVERYPKNTALRAELTAATQRASVAHQMWTEALEERKRDEAAREAHLQARVDAALAGLPDTPAERVLALEKLSHEAHAERTAALARLQAKREELGIHSFDPASPPAEIIAEMDALDEASSLAFAVSNAAHHKERALNDADRIELVQKRQARTPRASPAAPREPASAPDHAVKYTPGTRTLGYTLLEKDYLQQQADAHRATAARQLEFHQAALAKAKEGTRAHQEAALNVKLWKDQLANVESGEWLERNRNSLTVRYAEGVKAAISKGLPVPAEVIAQRPEFQKARTDRERYEKGRRTSFGNKTVAVDYTPQAARGYKAKRQDGKAIEAWQLDEIASGMTDIETILGPLHEELRRADLTIAHTSGTHPFLDGKAGGLYHVGETTVTIGTEINAPGSTRNERLQRTLGHELAGHWLDYEAGEALGHETSVARGKNRIRTSSLTEADYYAGNEHAQVIKDATRTMRRTSEVDHLIAKKRKGAQLTPGEEQEIERARIHLGPYWSAPEEVWARLVEQYLSTELEAKDRKGGYAVQESAYYHTAGAYWSPEDFEQLRPMVRAQLDRRVALTKSRAPARATA